MLRCSDDQDAEAESIVTSITGKCGSSQNCEIGGYGHVSEDCIIKLDSNLNNNNYWHINIFSHNINHFLYNPATLLMIIYLDHPIVTRQARKDSRNKIKTKGRLKNKADSRCGVNHESDTLKNFKLSGDIQSLKAEADVNCLRLPSSARAVFAPWWLVWSWPHTEAGWLRFQLWKRRKECFQCFPSILWPTLFPEPIQLPYLLCGK